METPSTITLERDLWFRKSLSLDVVSAKTFNALAIMAKTIGSPIYTDMPGVVVTQ